MDRIKEIYERTGNESELEVITKCWALPGYFTHHNMVIAESSGRSTTAALIEGILLESVIYMSMGAMAYAVLDHFF